mgnify:CR=1 FL=1
MLHLKSLLALLISFFTLGGFGQAYVSPRLLEKITKSPKEQQWVTLSFNENVNCQNLIEDFRKKNLSSSLRALETNRLLFSQAQRSQKQAKSIISSFNKSDLSQVYQYWIINIIIVKANSYAIQELAKINNVKSLDLIGGRFEIHEPIIPGVENKTANPNGVEPGLVAINAPAMWALGYTGRSRVVYDYDTGVWPNHPAFSNRFFANFYPMSQSWYGFFSDQPNGSVSDHGTHTLGTMAGLDSQNNDTIGVAFGAYWIANDFVTSTVAGLPPLVDMIGAFQWALNPDGDLTTTNDIPDVINNSWRWYDIGDTLHCGGHIVNLMNAIEAAGIANVFSGGNAGPSNTTISSPQRINTSKASTFSVGSVDGNQSFPYPISSFSSKGPTQCPGGGSLSIHPEVVAPGQNVRSAWGQNSYNSISGTSMAAPHVSGAILLLKEAFPNLSGDELLLALYNSATDMGSAGEDNTYGNGLIDVYAAYQFLALSHSPVDPLNISWDLKVESLSKPLAGDISCATGYDPIIVISNTGNNTISQVDFSYQINSNGNVVNHTWNGNLASGQSISVNLPTVSFTGFGNQEMTLRADINGVATEYDFHNNNRIVRFNRRENKSLPYTQDFENGFAEDILVLNEDGGIGWDTISISGRGSNKIAAQLPLYSYNPRESQKDGLISPEFSLPATGSSKLSFDYSYQRLLSVSALQDTFRVYASTDCGQTFPHLILEKHGLDLSTNDTATQNFIPKYQSHWKRDTVDLQAFAGSSILLQFQGVNRKGNNLYLDNISVYDGPDPVGLDEFNSRLVFNVFPNPVKNKLKIEIEDSEKHSFEVSVYDIQGKLVWKGSLAKSKNEINVRELSPGVYVLQLENNESLSRKKFVKD